MDNARMFNQICENEVQRLLNQNYENKVQPLFQFRCSIVVSISACHAEDPGSIPGRGVLTLCRWQEAV